MRVAPIVGHFHVEIDALRQCQTEAGIEHEQRRVAFITLGIEINRVGICHILVLITLPCEYTIVVAVDDMIVVAKASAKQYAASEIR